ncbi:MAG: pimeloyl-ACP methyl ester carboxylesterase [Arenicella sp.]|jgi:pimeloyl-ACP methyl ester carboxylesterase
MLRIIFFSLVFLNLNTVAGQALYDQTGLEQAQEYPTYFAHSNGISIAYQDFGDKNNETILLVMGLGGQLIHWDDAFVTALVDSGYRVIRFDNRDVGLSEKFYTASTPGLYTGLRYKLGMSLNSPYKLSDMAADGIGLFDHLEIKQAHVAGVSMGGMIAQLMASNYPDRVLSLTSIMSTSGAKHLPEGTLKIENRDRKNLSREEIIQLGMLTMKAIYAKESNQPEEYWYRRSARAYDRSHYDDGFARQFWAIADSGDRVEELKSITQPTIVIHGKIDPLIPIVHGRHTAQSIANSEFLELDDMGHYMASEHHQRVLDAMLRTMRKASQ